MKYTISIFWIAELPKPLRLYHFPYKGADKEDSREFEVRYEQYRLEDDGLILLHGHTHQAERLSGKNSIHVGVDAWNFKPVALLEITALLSLHDN